MSSIDLRNWDDYYFSFNQTFALLYADWTDPKRFPKDDRDNNGFWVPYKCHSVWGHFECPVNPSCSWQSHDVQVDLLVRYNFKLQRGEVKIDREYRQSCPRHGGPPVHPMVGDMGGAKWVMQRLMRFIRARFYMDKKSSSRTRVSTERGPSSAGASLYNDRESGFRSGGSLSVSSSNTGSGTSLELDRIESDFEAVRERRRRSRPLYKPQPDHNPHNCEACLLRRCPRPWRYPIPDKEHEIPGTDINNNQDMEFISWAILSPSGKPFFVM